MKTSEISKELAGLINRDAGIFSGKKLWRIKERPHVLVDEAIGDSEMNLTFMRIFASDTFLQQFLASLVLPVTEGGVNVINLELVTADKENNADDDDSFPDEGDKYNAQDGDDDDYTTIVFSDNLLKTGDKGNSNLNKLTGRVAYADAPQFANLSWAWIYTHEVAYMDNVNCCGSTIMTAQRFQKNGDAMAWQMIKKLSQLPILEEWHDYLYTFLKEKKAIRSILSNGGGIVQLKIKLPIDFNEIICNALKKGFIRVTEKVAA